MSDGYHHGDLRRALLDESAQMIDEVGPSSLSLRELARRAGVSHGAPAHHFGDRRGLLTALAAQGLRLLAADVAAATAGGFDEAAVAYVRFAREHPGHYAVMHRPELLHADDGELIAARASSMEALMAGVESIPAERRAHLTTSEAAHVAWSLVHGLASLAAEGATPDFQTDDLARRAARQLFA
ncbi:TetR/AcrR family transcriptional regulator [Parenemella sanctibonifatiensis]|uniref:TetR family transcriptional regulator n=1 Tax=Parenemella sanctibonifatiensis TaxID=2016505 RepID=A0A255EGL9_9ACTN|nr:TetR/AcrR family transcriptional regulator [Parenemella sanctibonifatiensis]OYN90684.1 TetR family transcriptional regulator [Parenemella sanctibonifatiensis]